MPLPYALIPSVNLISVDIRLSSYYLLLVCFEDRDPGALIPPTLPIFRCVFLSASAELHFRGATGLSSITTTMPAPPVRASITFIASIHWL